MSVAPALTSFQKLTQDTETLVNRTNQRAIAKKQSCCNCSNVAGGLENLLEKCFERIDLAKKEDTPQAHLAMAAKLIAETALKMIQIYAPNTELAAIANEIELLQNMSEQQIMETALEKLEEDLPQIIATATKVVEFALGIVVPAAACTIQ